MQQNMGESPRKRSWAQVAGIAAAVAVVAAIVPAFGAVRAGADEQAQPAAASTDSLVEDFVHPGAEQLLAEQNIRLLKGDGHIMLADCTVPVSGDIGYLKVWTTDETIGSDGTGRLCFTIGATTGFLNLEVPGVYEIRGDGQRTGTGHEVTADLKTDEGQRVSVDVDPDGSTQVGLGTSPDAPPTMLLKLTVTG